MKILYDHQIFDFQKFGGVSRYFYELMTHLNKDVTVQWELPILFSDNEYLKNMPGFAGSLLPKSKAVDPYKNFLRGANFRGKNILYQVRKRIFPEPGASNESELNKSKTIEKIKEGNFDVFHPTYYDDYFLDYIGDKPFILTVYDLIHQIFPEFGLYEKVDKNKPLLAKASKIIAISESTKADLISMFNVDERKITVTHLASSLQKTAAAVSEGFIHKLPEKYLLYVGGRGTYKNFLFFAHIVAALMEEDKDLCVVCTGSPFDENEQYLFKKTGIADRIYHTYANDQELRHLYKRALALVFPSMYEGFGLPILEAFSCGCPVLVSNTSSLIEIGGDAASYFEPKNPASMINAIKKILADPTLKNEKIRAGYRQAEMFSWQKTTDETKEAYRQVLAECHS